MKVFELEAREEQGGDLTLTDSCGRPVIHLRPSATTMLVDPQGPAEHPGQTEAGLEIRLQSNAPAAAESRDVQVGLDWATYLGGDTGGEYIHDLAIGADGRTYATGFTRSTDFPVTPGAYDTTENGAGTDPFESDVFVACLSADGSTLDWATYLGGKKEDRANAIAVDGNGSILVAGFSNSKDFPTTPGSFDPLHNGGKAFVARLSADGTTLVAATALGADAFSEVYRIVIDDEGCPTVGGQTSAAAFPTTPGALQEGPPSTAVIDDSGFISTFDASLSSLQYSSYLGGQDYDFVSDIAVGSSGLLVVTGLTDSIDFPVPASGLFPTHPGPSDAGFVLQFDPSSSSVSAGTFLPRVRPYRCRWLLDGSIVVVGRTGGPSEDGTSPPTTAGSFDTTYNGGGSDAFLVRLSAGLDVLHLGSYLGAEDEEIPWDVAVDSAGRPVVFGFTRSITFPTTGGCLKPKKENHGSDAFLTRLSADGSKLLYSTYFGGPGDDANLQGALALDAFGRATIGIATSGEIPVTPGAFDTTPGAIFDAGLARLTLLPGGVQAFGDSSPDLPEPLVIGVTAQPQVGSPEFGVTCLNAPPESKHGWILLSGNGLSSAISWRGTDVWVDPFALRLIGPFSANGAGYAEIGLPLPPDTSLIGLTTFWQFEWQGPVTAGPWWASDAMALTIQP